MLWQGGEQRQLGEHTQVCDSSGCVKPTQPQREI